MGKFYKWLETNIGDFSQEAIEEDPGNIHPIAFDHAWEKGETEQSQWMQSVHKTAKGYHSKLAELNRALRGIPSNDQKYYLKSFVKANNSDQMILTNFINSLQTALNAISSATMTMDQAHDKFLTTTHVARLKIDNFGLVPEITDRLNNQKIINSLDEYLAPEYAKLIKNIIGWVYAIAQKFKESRSDILGHQLRNHKKSNIPEIAKKVYSDIIELHDLYRTSEIPAPFKTELISRLYSHGNAIDSIMKLSKEDFSIMDKNPIRRSLLQNYLNESSMQNYIFLSSRLVDWGLSNGEEITEKYKEFLKHLNDLCIALEVEYGSGLKTESNNMGNFFKWVLKESTDPGHYHFTKFDDFLSGENYEKQSWIDGVVQTAETLRNDLQKIEGKKIYQVQPNSHEEYSISDLMHYIDPLLGNVIRIFAHLNVEHWDQNSPDFKYMKDKLPSINHESLLHDAQKCLKPEYFKQIDEMINFINRMFQILEHPSFKKELINYKFRDHTADKIVDFAKSFVANMDKLEKRFANQIEISEDDHKTIEKIKKIANGESIKKNYNKNFEYLNNYNIFNVSSEGFTHSSDYFQYEKLSNETSRNLLDLIRAIEFSYGRLKTD
jgi:hypothetical protein